MSEKSLFVLFFLLSPLGYAAEGIKQMLAPGRKGMNKKIDYIYGGKK
jgi:hypothetical protein